MTALNLNYVKEINAELNKTNKYAHYVYSVSANPNQSQYAIANCGFQQVVSDQDKYTGNRLTQGVQHDFSVEVNTNKTNLNRFYKAMIEIMDIIRVDSWNDNIRNFYAISFVFSEGLNLAKEFLDYISANYFIASNYKLKTCDTGFTIYKV
jgi:hypothetical protein